MIRIRPYRDADEQAILSWSMDEDTFYKWSFGILGEYPLTAEKFRTLGKHARFTALDDGDVVGFFIIRNPGEQQDQLRFGYVLVDPDRCGQGIGKEMLRQGLKFAFSVYQAERVSLGVFENNAPAVACYSAIGFGRTGAVESYTVRGQTLEVIEMAIHRIAANQVQVLRAEEEWQRAGAYSVRIEGMNRQYHIPLEEEFDEKDGDGSRYIVLLDDGYPVATCRFFEADARCVHLGRVVVLPQYRGRELGRKTLMEAEDWIRDCGYEEILLDSRVNAVEFYEKLGYQVIDGSHYMSGPFECVQMRKLLRADSR